MSSNGSLDARPEPTRPRIAKGGDWDITFPVARHRHANQGFGNLSAMAFFRIQGVSRDVMYRSFRSFFQKRKRLIHVGKDFFNLRIRPFFEKLFQHNRIFFFESVSIRHSLTLFTERRVIPSGDVPCFFCKREEQSFSLQIK
jgi:hypothetical protein